MPDAIATCREGRARMLCARWGAATANIWPNSRKGRCSTRGISSSTRRPARVSSPALPAVSKSRPVSSKYRNQGQRGVTGQRVMQGPSDMFLGWTRVGGRDLYVRQLRDMKFAADPATFNARRLMQYASLCGAVVARAHAKSTDAAVLSGYLGSKATFDDAIAQFARAYADQGERD